MDSVDGPNSSSYELWKSNKEALPHVLVCPVDWQEAMEEVNGIAVLRKTSSFLICGQSQSGKSTFCRYVANSLLNAKEAVVALLDLDPGQSEITPPVTIRNFNIFEVF